MSYDMPLIFVFYVSILFPLSPPLLPLLFWPPPLSTSSSPFCSGFLLSPPLFPPLFWPPAEIESNPRGHLRQPRTLGLAIVPGEHIVSIAIAKNYVSEPPPAQPVSPQSHTEQTLPESSELSHTHTYPSEMPHTDHTLPVTSDRWISSLSHTHIIIHVISVWCIYFHSEIYLQWLMSYDGYFIKNQNGARQSGYCYVHCRCSLIPISSTPGWYSITACLYGLMLVW